MAKNKISEYSSTSADNTDVSNVNIAEGCSPANVNNAIRSVMAQLKDFQSANPSYYTADSDALAIGAGGTGAITATTARTNLGAAKSGANSDITSITGLTTGLSVAQGGTGQTTYTDGQILIGNTTGNTLAKTTLTAGNNITITNGSGAITIASDGVVVTAGSFVVGNTYTIKSLGTTTFTSIGASSNTVGVIFTATGVGSGTGTATVTTTAASDTIAGIVELATNAESVTGTDTTKAITPSSLKAGLNATGTAPIFAPRAWVAFDASRDSSGATNTSLTNRFIYSSGNVASVLKTATGTYTITFTTAMPDANYAVLTNSSATTNIYSTSAPISGTLTTSAFQMKTGSGDTGNESDRVYGTAVVFK
jgi:hypothetical protein